MYEQMYSMKFGQSEHSLFRYHFEKATQVEKLYRCEYHRYRQIHITILPSITTIHDIWCHLHICMSPRPVGVYLHVLSQVT